MSKEKLIEQLTDYQLRHNDEAETALRLIDFVRQNPLCFEKDLKIGHVTGSAWVVNNFGTEVLLTHHKKLDKWVQLGGHADGNSDIAQVAFREAVEESGLADLVLILDRIFDIDIHPIPARGQIPEHFHYDVRYAFRVTGSHEYSVSDESHDLRWVKVDEIEKFSTENSMLRMSQKWLKIMALPEVNATIETGVQIHL